MQHLWPPTASQNCCNSQENISGTTTLPHGHLLAASCSSGQA